MQGPGGVVQIAPCRPEAVVCVTNTPTIEEVILKGKMGSKSHRQCLDVCRHLMHYDPSKRITTEQALQHPFFRMDVPYPEVEAAKRRTRRIIMVSVLVVLFLFYWTLIIFFPGVFFWRSHLVSKVERAWNQRGVVDVSDIGDSSQDAIGRRMPYSEPSQST